MLVVLVAGARLALQESKTLKEQCWEPKADHDLTSYRRRTQSVLVGSSNRCVYCQRRQQLCECTDL